ncbi:MAG: hypothetical protein K0S32_3723 [Bacteroidetes bacterium]|jgi:hypothetical protein|nr:hypothetical protein [Bacteroidota bacterium]
MLQENWLGWTEEIVYKDFDRDQNKQYPPQQDLDIIHRFLNDLGPFLNSLIKEGSNFAKLLNNDRENAMIQNAYYDANEVLHDCLETDVWKQDFWKERGSYYSVFRSNPVRDAGLTGSSLRAKLHLLRKLWKRTYERVKSAGRAAIDLLDDIDIKLFRKTLSFLNSFLGSVAKAFPPIEAMKEVKDLTEGFIDILEQPTN